MDQHWRQQHHLASFTFNSRDRKRQRELNRAGAGVSGGEISAPTSAVGKFKPKLSKDRNLEDRAHQLSEGKMCGMFVVELREGRSQATGRRRSHPQLFEAAVNKIEAHSHRKSRRHLATHRNLSKTRSSSPCVIVLSI